MPTDFNPSNIECLNSLCGATGFEPLYYVPKFSQAGNVAYICRVCACKFNKSSSNRNVWEQHISIGNYVIIFTDKSHAYIYQYGNENFGKAHFVNLPKQTASAIKRIMLSNFK